MRFLKNKIGIFALCLLLVCGGIFVYGQSTGSRSPVSDLLYAVTTPFRSLMAGAAEGLNGVLGYLHRYDDLEAENEALRQELYELRQLAEDYYAAVDENQYLRALAGLTEKHTDFTWELANITATAASGYQKGFSIDRGKKHGVEVGDPVMSDAGLVGYIDSVSTAGAHVTTVIDLGFKAGARISRTRETAVAEGSFELAAAGKLRLSYLDNDMDLEPGDLIETSGAGGLFPKGLLIGTVEDIAPEAGGISSYASITPAVVFEDLTAVFVVKDFEVAD